MRNKTKTKTKKVKRKKLRLGRVFVFVCLIILIVFGVKNIDKLKARNIVVSGNKYVKTSEIINLGGLEASTSYINPKTKKICSNIKQNKLIKSCKFKRTKDLNLVLEVEEDTPLFYYSHEDKLMLKSKKLVNIKNTFGVPNLINYVPKDVLDEFTAKFGELKTTLVKNISEIEYTPSKNKKDEVIDDKRFMLTMNDGNTIYINNKNLKILNKYDKIYASINHAHGIFNFDCDYNNYYYEPY